MNKLSLSAVLLALFVFVGAAQAAWRWEGGLVDGRAHVMASVSENGKQLRISCESGNDRTVFQVELSGSGIPHLDRTDGVQESLVLRFGRADRAYNELDGWADVWYSGDKRTWSGALYLKSKGLDVFGAASELRVLNTRNKLVAVFPLSGSRKAEKAIRAICHQGMAPARYLAGAAPSANQPAAGAGTAVATAERPVKTSRVPSGVPELAMGPLTIADARKAVGYPGRFGAGAQNLKVAIIDAGFAGLRDWLAEGGGGKPYERDATFIRTELKSDSNHGFNVYRVMRQVLPDAKIYVYEVALDSAFRRSVAYVEDMSRFGVTFVNMSISGGRNPYDPPWSDYVEFGEALVENGVYAMVTPGNMGRQFHTFEAVPAFDGRSIEIAPVKGRNVGVFGFDAGARSLRLYWPARPGDPGLALEFYQRIDGKLTRLGEARTKGGHVEYVSSDGTATGTVEAPEGTISVIPRELLAGREGRIHTFIRVNGDPAVFKGRKMTIWADRGLHVGGRPNGSGSISQSARIESPNLIAVGSFGRNESGEIAPSAYSSHGWSLPEPEPLPHVIGPGSLKMPEGDVIHGTSFASPFVTAVLSGLSWRVMNPKNVAEKVSSHSFLFDGNAGAVSSRWGVPDAGLMLQPERLKKLLGSDRIDDVAHRVEGEDIVVTGRITRCCMEGVRAELLAIVAEVTGKKDDGSSKLELNRDAVGTTRLTTDRKAYDGFPFEIRIPRGKIAGNGNELELVFGVRRMSGDRGTLVPVGTEVPYRLSLR